MTEETVERKSVTNIQSEMMFIGALYKQPDLYVSYGGYMRSQYDFSDEACKFFYDMFEIMYKTFTQTIEEDKVNMFMSQSDERLRTYKRYKGWKTISSWMQVADCDDFKNIIISLRNTLLLESMTEMDILFKEF